MNKKIKSAKILNIISLILLLICFILYIVFFIDLLINNKNNEVNVNYYENKKLQNYLNDIIKKSLEELIKIGINREVCYCIGSGENYQYLLKLNDENHYFKRIVALEHPRYIMQYNKDKTAFYMNKYLNELNNKL